MILMKRILNLKVFPENFIIFYNIKIGKMTTRLTRSKGKHNIKISYEEPAEDNISLPKISKLDLIKKHENNVKSEKDKKVAEDREESSNNPNIPAKFWDQFKSIQKMREKQKAPVDTMGADCCPDPKNKDRKTYKFQFLISLLLSSQTKDPITFSAMEKLIKHGLTIDNILKTAETEIKDLIYGVSFHNNKAKYIKKLAEVLHKDYEDDAPETLDKLLKLPGIGPKMSFIYLKYVCEREEGIAVDTHVHRICNRLAWVETKQPEQTRIKLQDWVPQNLWGEINELLVGFGQTICGAVAPKCEECLLNKTCDFGVQRIKLKKNKSKSKSKKSNKSLK
jgi:endonuclease-3